MSLVCVGGRANSIDNNQHQQIVCHAMKNQIRIHTCLKYGDALPLIRKCVDMVGLPPRLILKVYINSSERWLRSSIDTQLETTCNILGLDQIESLQICCNPSYKHFAQGSPFRRKLDALKASGVVKKLYLENYWQYSDNISLYLEDKLIDGCIFYHNIYLREADNAFAKAALSSKKEIITMRSLGGNDKGLLSYYSDSQKERLDNIYQSSNYKNHLEFKIAFLKSISNISGAVCGTGKYSHYLELINAFDNVEPLKCELSKKIRILHDEVWANKGIGNGEGLQRRFGRKNFSEFIRRGCNQMSCLLRGVRTGYDW